MKIDRSEVFRDAHRRYRAGLRLRMGWSFSQCLKTAWAAARIRQEQVRAYHAAPRNNGRQQTPFPNEFRFAGV